MLEIEIAYGLADRQELHVMRVEEGTTVRQAALRSPIAERFPDVDLNTAPLGIFGKRVADDTPLLGGERVELYRPLLIDPKEARRRRAAQNTQKGTA